MPLASILDKKPSTQPFILAVGTCKAAISKYYIVFDENILPCPRHDIICAFDLCFKVHFVYNLKFAKALESFYKFVQDVFYDIKIDVPTTRMRELRTKINNVIMLPKDNSLPSSSKSEN